MAINSIYLRPSADISVGHTLSSGSSGYLLIDDEAYDSASTYLGSSAADDATTSTLTSSFKLSGIIPPSEKIKIKDAKIVYRVYTNSYCSNGTIFFTVGVNGSSFTSSSTDISSSTAYSTEKTDVTFGTTNFVNTINNYIASNGIGSFPEVTISFTTSHIGGSKGAGTLNITQVYIELTYDIGISRKVSGQWKNAIIGYQKTNGAWTKINNTRSALSSRAVSLGHEQIAMNAVSANCTDVGFTKGYKCSMCGKIIVPQEVVPALGHSIVIDKAVVATCVASGLTEGSHCSRCSEVLIARETIPIDPNNHNIVSKNVVEPTCVKTGTTAGTYCSRCNATISGMEIIPATGVHNYVVLENSEECSMCGHVLRRFGVAYYGKIDKLLGATNLPGATSVGDYALFGGGSSSAAVTAYNKSLTRSSPGDLSVQRNNMRRAAATVGNSYALFGGGYYSESKATVDAYNTSLTRSTPTELSVARDSLGAIKLGNYVLFGGGNASNRAPGQQSTVDVYNASLTRSTTTGLSVARSGETGMAVASVGNYALFGGGHTLSYDDYMSTVDAYNTSLTRSIPASLSAAKDSIGAASVGNYALFAGGTNGSYLSSVDAYNTSLTRSTPTELSEARSKIGAASTGSYAIFFGGYKEGSVSSKVVDVYDTSLTISRKADQSTYQDNYTATTIGNYAIFAGGGTTVLAYVFYD